MAAPAPATGQVSRDAPPRIAAGFSYAPIVRNVGPTIVTIYAKKIVERRVSPFFDRFFGSPFGEGFPGLRRRGVENSLGSGVIVRPEGLVVTNSHVIEGAQDITVVLSDRREFPAKILLSDDRTDIAVLRIDVDENLPAAIFADSESLEVGDVVLALGNPFGVGRTVTSGIISALARTSVGGADYRFFIQTDAAINPGNSGGALVDINGNLVGINTMIYSRDGGSLGIGFAIPSNLVRIVVNSAAKGDPLVRPWLSLSGRAVDADLAAALGMKFPAGMLVEHVIPGGPAERADIRPGDVILSVEERPIEDKQTLRFHLAVRPLEESVRMRIMRDGDILTADFTLVPPPEDPPRNETLLDQPHPLFGATVANMSPALAAETGFDETVIGVVILQVARNSPAARYGFRSGDIVLGVSGQRIERVRDLVAALADEGRSWHFIIRRDGRTIEMRM